MGYLKTIQHYPFLISIAHQSKPKESCTTQVNKRNLYRKAQSPA